jgi:hypothetical protein
VPPVASSVGGTAGANQMTAGTVGGRARGPSEPVLKGRAIICRLGRRRPQIGAAVKHQRSRRRNARRSFHRDQGGGQGRTGVEVALEGPRVGIPCPGGSRVHPPSIVVCPPSRASLSPGGRDFVDVVVRFLGRPASSTPSHSVESGAERPGLWPPPAHTARTTVERITDAPYDGGGLRLNRP